MTYKKWNDYRVVESKRNKHFNSYQYYWKFEKNTKVYYLQIICLFFDTLGIMCTYFLHSAAFLIIRAHQPKNQKCLKVPRVLPITFKRKYFENFFFNIFARRVIPDKIDLFYAYFELCLSFLRGHVTIDLRLSLRTFIKRLISIFVLTTSIKNDVFVLLVGKMVRTPTTKLFWISGAPRSV